MDLNNLRKGHQIELVKSWRGTANPTEQFVAAIRNIVRCERNEAESGIDMRCHRLRTLWYEAWITLCIPAFNSF